MKEMDYIKITNLKIYAYHGVLPEEQEKGQEFFVNAKMYMDFKKAERTDQLEDTVNYAQCCQLITSEFQSKRFQLIEAACQHVIKELLYHFPVLDAIEMEVCKPHAPIGLPFENVSVTCYRKWHKVYLSIGSNIGDKEAYLQGAIERLKTYKEIRNIRVSEWIVTKPYGPVEQDDFLNGVIELETLLDPEDMLEILHEVETMFGRKREIVWGPRTIDLDIVFYDKLVYESDTLIIPHIDMHNRQFVLAPLCQLAPNYRHPITGKTVEQMLKELG